jgi:hypothetical protein
MVAVILCTTSCLLDQQEIETLPQFRDETEVLAFVAYMCSHKDGQSAFLTLHSRCDLLLTCCKFTSVGSDVAIKSHVKGICLKLLEFVRSATIGTCRPRQRADVVLALFSTPNFVELLDKFSQLKCCSNEDRANISWFLACLAQALRETNRNKEFLENACVQSLAARLGTQSGYHAQLLQKPSPTIESSKSAPRFRQVDFRSLSVSPSIDDLAVNHLVGLPKPPFSTFDALMQGNFMLLREDFLNPIREDLLRMKINPMQALWNVTVDHIDSNGHFTFNFELHREHSYHHKKRKGQGHKDVWQRTKLLKQDALLLFWIDEEIMFTAHVVHRRAEDLVKGCVSVALMDDDTTLYFLGQLILLEEHRQKFRVTTASSNFFAYKPILERLQKLSSTSVPLIQELLGLPAQLPPAHVDTSPSTSEQLGDIIRKHASLNESQIDAITRVLESRVSLVQGPPGIDWKIFSDCWRGL